MLPYRMKYAIIYGTEEHIMPKHYIKSKVAEKSERREKVTVNIFRNEDDIFSSTLKRHRHDKSFFVNMAKKAGIYDSAGNLEASYKR